jgi:hypothetical protein
MREWYSAYLESPGGQRLVALFDEEAPEFQDIDVLKKVEFALLPAGHVSGFLETTGTSAASVSQSA